MLQKNLQKNENVTNISVFLKEGQPLDFAALVKQSALKDKESQAEMMINIKKTEDTNLSFRVFDLTASNIDSYLQPHKKDHFSIIMVESGEVEIHLEEEIIHLKAGKISLIFPKLNELDSGIKSAIGMDKKCH